MKETRTVMILSAILLMGVCAGISRADVFIILDDFESYTDDVVAGEAIWQTWIAEGGAQVGHSEAPYAELSRVFGGSQSMPFYYDNSEEYSEATKTFTDSRDLSGDDGTLVIHFCGNADNSPASIYCAITDSDGNRGLVPYAGPSGATQQSTWNWWNIELQGFAGQEVDLAHVNTISLGFIPGPGDDGSGLMYFDDIGYSMPPPCGKWHYQATTG